MKSKKILALILAALMIIGVLPVATFADDDVTPGIEYVLDEESVEFKFDEQDNPKVTYKYVGIDKEYSQDAEIEKTEKATCTENSKYWLKATIKTENESKVFHSEEAISKHTEDKLGEDHKWEIASTKVVEAADCTKEGKADVTYKCSVCGETKVEEGVKLDKQEHTFGEAVVTKEAGSNVVEKDGVFVLDDPTKEGSYFVITTKTCKVCKETEEERKEVKIPANQVDREEVSASKNIEDALEGMDPKSEDFPKDGEIALEDCTKDGSYTVTRYDADGNELGSYTHTVKAHHIENALPEIKVKDEKQEGLVRVNEVKDKDGNVTGYEVVNLNCKDAVAYDEIITCSVCGKEVRKTAKTAEPNPDYHVIATEVKKTADAMKKADKKYTDDEIKAQLTDTISADDKDFVKVGKNTATCTADGTVKVTFTCKVCKAEVTSVELVTKKLGHEPKQVIENQVDPTCEALGTYDLVWKCTKCGESCADKDHVDVKGIRLPRLKHSNETEVTSSGIGTDDTTTDTNAEIRFIGEKVIDWNAMAMKADKDDLYDEVGDFYLGENGIVSAEAYTLCTYCGKHEVVLDAAPLISIVSVTKEKESGEAGSITLKAVYTKADKTKVEKEATFPYFSSGLAYAGRVEKAPFNGLKKDNDGVYRYYISNEVAKDYTGLVEYNGGEFYVVNGVLASDKNGLTLVGNEWVFLANGQVQKQHTGLAEYNGEWFYIVNGRLSTVVNGLVDYDGGKFLFAEGRLVKEYSGLYQDFDGIWYFLANGQVQTQYTGVAMYDGAFFVVEKGVFNNTYNGVIDYDGAKFNVVAGQLYDQVA